MADVDTGPRARAVESSVTGHRSESSATRALRREDSTDDLAQRVHGRAASRPPAYASPEPDTVPGFRRGVEDRMYRVGESKSEVDGERGARMMRS